MTEKMNPFLLTDFYKVGHVFQYPPGTEFVYSNMTARGSRMDGVDETVFFGLQYFIKKYLQQYFDENFFFLNRGEVMDQYKSVVSNALGGHLPTYEHIENLHTLGYLPLHITALPEGARVPLRVPYFTIENTNPEFYWLTNFVETLMSCTIWPMITSATIADIYRTLLSSWGYRTGMPPEFIPFQGHDFSFRGLSSLETATASGMGHLTSFCGTDTIPAIVAMQKYYYAGSAGEVVGTSVPATEHSVMCSGSKEN